MQREWSGGMTTATGTRQRIITDERGSRWRLTLQGELTHQLVGRPHWEYATLPTFAHTIHANLLAQPTEEYETSEAAA